MPLPPDHALRAELIRETHARPAPLLTLPVTVSHLAVLMQETAGPADRDHLARLASHRGVAMPPDGARHAVLDLGSYRVKWERHTEFASYTFIRVGASDRPFSEPALRAVPGDWLAGVPGELLVGLHLEMVAGPELDWPVERLAGLFGTDRILGSQVSGGAGRVWSDFQPHADGFHRILVSLPRQTRPTRAGRLLQRLLEIETYRMMALLGLPVARDATPRMTRIEADLARLAGRLPALSGLPDEQAALHELTLLAAADEAIAAETRYRLSATQAYAEIVESRIQDIREDPIEGIQRVGSFVLQRLTPAVATCAWTARRQDELANRIDHALTLLRTRVDVALEGQNQQLLTTMNRRAAAQLRLQETVEGLSVVAISYYTLGLLGYLFKGVQSVAADFNISLATAISLPLVVGLVFFTVRQIRRHAHRDQGEH